MKFHFENFGYIDKGDITPGNLTLICGENNIGKTYLNYAIYNYLYTFKRSPIIKINSENISELINNGTCKVDLNNIIQNFDSQISDFSMNFSKDISEYFSADSIYFDNVEMRFDLNDYNYNFNINKEFKNEVKINNTDKIIYLKESNTNILELFIEQNSKSPIPPTILKEFISIICQNILFNEIKDPYLITSERTGVTLFYKELDENKNFLIDKIAKSEQVNIFDLFNKKLSKYAIPIKKNIDDVRDLDHINKLNSWLSKEKKVDYSILMKKLTSITNGNYKIVYDQIYFQPQKESKRDKVQPIPLYIASSAEKSLFLLFLYLKAIAKPNDILMIDEPELNLHPSNQVIMARLLANIVNLGIDVMITTHSDYIIKELNNLIMLSNDFPDKNELITKYKYDELDILKPEKVKAYFVEKHKINEAKVDSLGINYEFFDDTIFRLNQISDDIYYSLES